MEKTTNKVAYLDGIRGVAAFLVFVHHFCLAFYPAYYDWNASPSNLHGWDVKYGQSIFSVFTNGNFYVCIFFVLSGLVLSRKYFYNSSVSVLVSAAQRRYLRLYIPVAFTLLLSYTLLTCGLYFNVPVCKIAHSEWWFMQWTFSDPGVRLLRCLGYTTMLQGDSAFDTCLWTMPVEFYNSLFVFAFLALTHKTKNRLATGILILVALYLVDSYNSFAFMFGILLNYIANSRQRLNRYVTLFIALILLAIALMLGAYPTNNVIKSTFFAQIPAWILPYTNWAHTVGACLLVLSFVLSSIFQHFISLRFFRFLGYISFSLYLLHPLVIGSLGSYIFLRLYNTLGYNDTVAVVFTVTSLLCMLLGWLMTRYIDGPGMRFAQYVYERYIKHTSTEDIIAAG